MNARNHVEQESWTHAHFPGGGTWILSATVVADFIHHLIDRSVSPHIGPTAFADYYDTFSGVSGGSIVLAGILMPDEFGSLTARHRTFTRVREQLMTDSVSIFEPERQQGFFFRKTLQSAIGHAADSLKMRFDHARDMVDGSQTRRAIEWMESHALKALHALSDSAAQKSHFNPEYLYKRLKDRLQISYPDDRIRQARMVDLIKPAIIPAIRLSPNDNSYLLYTNPPGSDINLSHVPDRFKGQYVTSENVSTAAFFSSLQSPLFPAATSEMNGPQTDGGALFTGRSAVDRFRQIHPEFGWQQLRLNIFECNMSDQPPMVTRNDLERTFIAASLASNLQSQKNARRHDDYMALMTDPRTEMMVEFSRAARPGFPAPMSNKLRGELDRFASEYCHHNYADAVQTHIPRFSALSQAATSAETHGQFIDAGIQTVVRMLPELLRTSKDLIQYGPLSKKLTPEQIEIAIADIDHRFPAHETAGITHFRRLAARNAPLLPAHNDFVYFASDSSEIKRAAPRSSVQPVSEFIPAK